MLKSSERLHKIISDAEKQFRNEGAFLHCQAVSVSLSNAQQHAHLRVVCLCSLPSSHPPTFLPKHTAAIRPPRKHHPPPLRRSWWLLFAAVAPTLQTQTMSSLQPPPRPRPSPLTTTWVMRRITRTKRGGWNGARRVPSVGSRMARLASSAPGVPSTVTRTAKGK